MNTQLVLFDYNQLDSETGKFVQARTSEIKALMKRTAQDIVEIGLKLIEVKERLPHGAFGDWLQAEFEWSYPLAAKFMNVANQFKSINFIDLQVAPSALYLLAAPSVPDDARQEAIDRAQQGEAITHTKAKEIAANHKESFAPDSFPNERRPYVLYPDGQQEFLTMENIDQTRAMMDKKGLSYFTCPVCGDIFDQEVWHCPYCDHHWLTSRTECSNCYNDRPTGKAMSNAWKMREQAPDIFEKVATAEITISQAKNEIRRQELVQQQAAIAKGEVVLPEGVFEIIVVDPPWPYGTEYDSEGRRAANPYPEMSLEQIGAINLPSADDCILWLWTTHKFMRYSFQILDGWGFRDVSIITWEKDQIGLGQWLRSNSEFCIMAVKGKPQVNLTNQRTVIHGPMREHSRKPDEFYLMIDQLCIGRKLDYFARQQRPGWAVAGSETDKFNGGNDDSF